MRHPFGKPLPPTLLVSLSPSSTVSPYSPSADPVSLPSNSPTAVSSAPQGQVVTRSEFDNLKSLMMSMAVDLAAMRKSSQVHCESEHPPLSTCTIETGSRN